MFILAKTTNHFYNFFFWFTQSEKKKKQRPDGNLGPDGKREDEKKKMKMAQYSQIKEARDNNKSYLNRCF